MFGDIYSGYDALGQLIMGANGLVSLVILIIMIVGYGKMFQKAGYAWWLSIIPIVNVWVLCKMAFRSGWYMFLLLIPIVHFFVIIKLYLNIARKFEYPGIFAVGLIFLNPIFVMIIAFSDAQWSEY